MNTSIENYKKLAAHTDSFELKQIAKKTANERRDFLAALKTGFIPRYHKNQEALAKIAPIWTGLFGNISNVKNSETQMELVIKSDARAAKRIDTYLFHYIPTLPHLNFLLEQMRKICQAIALLKDKYQSDPLHPVIVVAGNT